MFQHTKKISIFILLFCVNTKSANDNLYMKFSFELFSYNFFICIAISTQETTLIFKVVANTWYFDYIGLLFTQNIRRKCKIFWYSSNMNEIYLLGRNYEQHNTIFLDAENLWPLSTFFLSFLMCAPCALKKKWPFFILWLSLKSRTGTVWQYINKKAAAYIQTFSSDITQNFW